MTESESNPLNLRIHLQQIPVGIPEEQRAMPERLVGRRLEQIDAVPHQFVGAAIDVIDRNLERELQRSAACGRRRILRRPARPRQRKRVAADLIFDPSRRQLPRQRKMQNAS